MAVRQAGASPTGAVAIAETARAICLLGMLAADVQLPTRSIKIIKTCHKRMEGTVTCALPCFTKVLQVRKGFVRLALQTGASLVPVITYGETDTFKTHIPQPGSRVAAIIRYGLVVVVVVVEAVVTVVVVVVVEGAVWLSS